MVVHRYSDSNNYEVYPNNKMNVSFANWISGNIDTKSYDLDLFNSEQRSYTMQIDWVLYAKGEDLMTNNNNSLLLSKVSPTSSIQDLVTTFRDNGIGKVNTVEPHINNITEVTKNLELPTQIRLNQNYPNPFNPNTTISYSVTERRSVKLVIYDVLGREIRVLIDEDKPSGNYEVEFDGKNLASGIYFYRLQAADFAETKKMILLK